MQKIILQTLKSKVWRTAFPSQAMPAGKWKSQQCKQLAAQIIAQASELLSSQAIAKFSEGHSISERETNVLAKFVLVCQAEKKHINFPRTDHIGGDQYLQRFVQKYLPEAAVPGEREQAVGEQAEEPAAPPETTGGKSPENGGEVDFAVQFGRPWDGFYLKRPEVDNKIAGFLQNGQAAPLLLIGDTLAGKTRALHENMANHKPHPKAVYVKPGELRRGLDLPPDVGGQTLLVFDRLEEFLQLFSPNFGQFAEFMGGLCEKGAKIVATATPPAMHYCQNAGITGSFEAVILPPLAHAQVAEFQHLVNQRLDFALFDSLPTIGALLAGLSEKRRRLEKQLALPGNPKMAGLAENILFGLKCMDAAHNYSPARGEYSTQTLNAFCQRHTGKRISGNQWREALEWLQGQGLVKQQGDTIFADPAYLQWMVESEFQGHQIERYIFELYVTAAERIENGFYAKPAFYAQKIAQAGSFSDAERWYGRMESEGLPADPACLSALLLQCPDLASARQVVETAHRPPNADLIGKLLQKAANLGDALQFLAYLETAGAVPPPDALKGLAAFANSRQAGEELLATLQKHGLQADTSLMNRLMAQSGDFGGNLQWLHKIQPDLETFEILIGQASTHAQAGELMQHLRQANLRPNGAVYRALLPHAPDFGQALEIFGQMEREGVPPNLATYNMLLQLAPSLAVARTRFGQMQDAGIQPDAETYAALLQKTENAGDAERLLADMGKAGIKPDAAIYNTLLAKAADIGQCAGLLRKMEADGVALDASGLALLVQKAESYEDAMHWYSRHANSLPPDLGLFKALAAKTPGGDFKTAFNWLKAIADARIAPDGEALEIFVEKLAGNEQAFADHVMRLYPQLPANDCFHPVFMRIFSRIDYRKFIKFAEHQITRSDERIAQYAEQLINIGEDAEANSLLEKMKHKEETYRQLKGRLIL